MDFSGLNSGDDLHFVLFCLLAANICYFHIYFCNFKQPLSLTYSFSMFYIHKTPVLNLFREVYSLNSLAFLGRQHWQTLMSAFCPGCAFVWEKYVTQQSHAMCLRVERSRMKRDAAGRWYLSPHAGASLVSFRNVGLPASSHSAHLEGLRAARAPSGCGAVISLLRESGRKKKGRCEEGERGRRGGVAAAKSQLQRDDRTEGKRDEGGKVEDEKNH